MEALQSGVCLEAVASHAEEGSRQEQEPAPIQNQLMVEKSALGQKKRHKIAVWKHVQV